MMMNNYSKDKDNSRIVDKNGVTKPMNPMTIKLIRNINIVIIRIILLANTMAFASYEKHRS